MQACDGGPESDRGCLWRHLGAPPQELQLDFCLPTGQSFRWRKTGDTEYTGVIGSRLVCLRQDADDVWFRVLARGADAPPEGDAAELRDYFNLGTSLTELAEGWAARCKRFRAVSPHFPGARMLRQDPLECLFQFICSSNNHISRIHGMVERLCSTYGTPLQPVTSVSEPGEEGWIQDEKPAPKDGYHGGAAGLQAAETGPHASSRGRTARGKARGGKAAEVEATAAPPASTSGPLSFYAFPSLEQLSRATEEELRAAGFGYRARFIVGTTQALLGKPGGGREWLMGLRQVGLEEAVAALTELPGIGPKVAACICLFSLDKHAAIPVDTHVWQIAVRYYCPQLKGKSLTKKVHAEVQQVFVERFGPYAGWAHNTLFISELASQQHRLPEELRQTKKAGAAARGQRGRGRDEEEEEEDGVSRGAGDEETDGAACGPSKDADGGEGSDSDSERGGGGPSKQRRGTGRERTAGAKGRAGKGAAGAARGRRERPRQRCGEGPAAQECSSERGTDAGGLHRGGCAAAAISAAMLDGQADVSSPTSGIAAAATPWRGSKRRGPLQLPESPLAPSKRGAGRRLDVAAAPLDYRVTDFDDLAT